MLRLEPADLLAGTLGREGVEVAQDVAELVLGHLVVLRPGVGILDDQLLGARLAELVGDTRVPLGCLGEPLPDVGPATLAPTELGGGGHLAVKGRVEVVVGLALLHERGPLRVVEPAAVALRVVEPSEQAADRVGVDEIAEVVGVEDLLGQPVDALIEQPVQRQQQRRAGLGVVGDVEPETPLRVGEQRPHRPVTVVGMGEPLAPVLQLGDRSEVWGAGVDCAQRAAGDPGQVHDRRSLRESGIDGAGHDAPDPVPRAASCGRVVVAQRHDRDVLGQALDDRLPVRALVGPQQRDRRLVRVRVVRQRNADAGDDPV